MNTLDIFNILEYPWLYIVYIHNLLFELHGIVSNVMAFNLLCGEILLSSAHNGFILFEKPQKKHKKFLNLLKVKFVMEYSKK